MDAFSTLLFVDLGKKLTQACEGLAAAIEEFLGTGQAGEAGGSHGHWQASKPAGHWQASKPGTSMDSSRVAALDGVDPRCSMTLRM